MILGYSLLRGQITKQMAGSLIVSSIDMSIECRIGHQMAPTETGGFRTAAASRCDE